MSVQAKSAIWFVACSILQRGISFITMPIFARLIPSDQYGVYSIYLSWLQILTIITSLNLYYGVLNNGLLKYETDRNVYISSMQGLTLTITASFSLIFLFAHSFWSDLLGLPVILLSLMYIEMAVTPALQFWSGRQRFEFKYIKLVVITLIKSIANPILGLVLILMTEDKGTARVLSVVIIEVAFSGFFLIFQFVKGKRFIHLEYWKYALNLSLPLLPHYLSGIVLNQGDRLVIDRIVGKSEVAYYSVAYNIGMVVQVVTTAINNSLTPWIYQKLKKNDYIGIKSTINALLLLCGFVSFVLMMCSPELVMFFAPEEYSSSVYVIPPVAASVFFIFLYNILAIPQFYFEKTKFLAFASIIAAITNIILNIVFINSYGYIAAGYTTLVCYVLYSFGHFYVSNRLIKQNLNNVQLFDIKTILLLSLLMILIGIVCNFLFNYFVIRYFILILLVLISIFNKDRIIRVIGLIRKR